MPTTLSRPLEDIHVQLESASSRAQNLVSGLPPALLGRRPDPGSWSVAESIAHLSLTTDAYLPAIRQALEQGRGSKLRPPSSSGFRMELSARLLAWWLEPPYRLKSKTSAAFVPSAANPSTALPDFLGRQQQLLALLREAHGLAIDQLQIASPFAPSHSYNVYAAFRLIAVHERRHLWQAEQTARRLVALA